MPGAGHSHPMIVWLNGAFGAGKTVAKAIDEALSK